jgi:SpoVK/Ycf46/Vps4 family AAA+-type ATPase
MNALTKKITTTKNWKSIAFPSHTLPQIKSVSNWIKAQKNLKHKGKVGYRVLFCGPHKSYNKRIAALLGKQHNMIVYRIDISQIISKYVRETEKNLQKILSRAQHMDVILFFDEADSLFGKRTTVRDAHDRKCWPLKMPLPNN